MKLTPLQVIQDGEKELMDAITVDLDGGSLDEVFNPRLRRN